MTDLEEKAEEYFSHHNYALHNRYGVQKDIHRMIYIDGYAQGQAESELHKVEDCMSCGKDTEFYDSLMKENAELRQQVHKMKNCGNCKHSGINEEGYITCNANCFYDCRSSQVFDNKESKIDGWELEK